MKYFCPYLEQCRKPKSGRCHTSYDECFGYTLFKRYNQDNPEKEGKLEKFIHKLLKKLN